MSDTLTSWKEVAQYLGKGVRTVQRWEQQMGLPVRRSRGCTKGTVLAFADELDVWIKSQFERKAESEVEALRRELAEIKKENQNLRVTLKQAEPRVGIITPNETISADGPPQPTWPRYFRAIERSAAIRLLSAEIIEMSQSMRVLRQARR